MQPIKVLYAFDRRMIPSERWVGIVLRNLPPDVTAEIMKKNFSGGSTAPGFRILNVDQPISIRGHKCAMLTVEDIEQAELFCKKW